MGKKIKAIKLNCDEFLQNTLDYRKRSKVLKEIEKSRKNTAMRFALR